MEVPPIIAHIKKKIYSHPLQEDHIDASGNVFAISVPHLCTRTTCKGGRIILTLDRNSAIRAAYCNDIPRDMDLVLPSIETFAQRHWIVLHTPVEDLPTHDCLLKRATTDGISLVSSICASCKLGHQVEYACLARKWMLIKEIVHMDPGQLIARALVNL
jgi:hypothetical protein